MSVLDLGTLRVGVDLGLQNFSRSSKNLERSLSDISDSLRAMASEAEQAGIRAEEALKRQEAATKKAAASKALADLKRRTEEQKGALLDLGRAAGVAGAALAGVYAVGAKKAFDAAARLNDSIAAANQVFDESAESIQAWSKTSVDAFGQSRRATLEAATSFQTLLKNTGIASDAAAGMSRRLVELAADMAAFKGGRPEEAIAALGSALRGEMDPIEAYGVSLQETTVKMEAMKLGFIKTMNEGLAPSTKAAAVYSLILKQTGEIQGQFAREADSAAVKQAKLAAQFEDTAAKLGQDLLPAGTQLLDFLRRAIQSFGEMDPMVRNSTLGIGAFGAASLVAVGQVAQMVTAVQTLVTALGAAQVAALGAYGAIGAVIAIGGVAVATEWERAADASIKESEKPAYLQKEERIRANRAEIERLRRGEGASPAAFTIGSGPGVVATKAPSGSANTQARIKELEEENARESVLAAKLRAHAARGQKNAAAAAKKAAEDAAKAAEQSAKDLAARLKAQQGAFNALSGSGNGKKKKGAKDKGFVLDLWGGGDDSAVAAWDDFLQAAADAQKATADQARKLTREILVMKYGEYSAPVLKFDNPILGGEGARMAEARLAALTKTRDERREELRRKEERERRRRGAGVSLAEAAAEFEPKGMAGGTAPDFIPGEQTEEERVANDQLEAYWQFRQELADRKLSEELAAYQEHLRQMGDMTRSILEPAFENLFQGRIKGFFSSIVDSFKRMLVQLAAQAAASKVMQQLFGVSQAAGMGAPQGGGGFGDILGGVLLGGLTSGLGSAIGGALKGVGKIFGLAGGGRAAGGRPYIVGEQGPELFVPNGTGTVVPNGAVGGLTINVNAPMSTHEIARYFAAEVGREVSRSLPVARPSRG